MKAKYIGYGFLVIVLIFIIFWVGGLFNVAHEEFSPKAMLHKYEWFKQQHTQMEQIKNMITRTEADAAQFKEDNGKEMSKWDWATKDEWYRLSSVVRGYKEQYNSMAAEYNENSSKFNWKGFEGEVPQTVAKYDH